MSALELLTKAEAATIATDEIARFDLDELDHEHLIHLLNLTTHLSMVAERARMAAMAELRERRWNYSPAPQLIDL